jgi:hypothetical protein
MEIAISKYFVLHYSMVFHNYFHTISRIISIVFFPLVSHDPLQEKFGKLSAVVSCAGGQMMGCGLTAPWWIIAEVERMVFLFTLW